MKKLLFILALVVSACAVQAQPLGRSAVKTDSLKSSILGAEVKYNVYLPKGYDEGERYPVIYLLHGLSDTYEAWAVKGRMKDVADELMNSGECRKAVIVMPNAGGPDIRKTWNGYFNMPGWNYEDFFFNEFIPAVEAKYHVRGDKQHRAVMGLSMGGGGSAVYCQRHPDMFSSCYAMSAWLDNKSDDVETRGKDKDCLYYVGEAVRKHSALDFLDNADEAALKSLRTVKWFVDCGDDDFLFDVNVAFHQKMRDHKVKCELRVRDGVHNWEYWHTALRTALPFASRNFGL